MTAKANGKAKFRKCFRRLLLPAARRRKVIENALLRGGLLRFGARNSALAYITPGENYADNADRRYVQFAGLKSGMVDRHLIVPTPSHDIIAYADMGNGPSGSPSSVD